MRGVLPVLLIGFGIYLLRDYVFKSKKTTLDWDEYENRQNAPMFAGAMADASFRSDDYNTQNDFETETHVSAWKNRA
jgi:hypothetical protein